MQELAAAIEASELASFLRRARWTYPAVNAAHLVGIALLVGAIVPMDLRLVGLWRSDVRLETVLRLLRPVAAFGAGFAVLTGALLFTVQARDYVAMPLFAVKLTLVALGLAHALAWGDALARAPRARQRRAGALSLAIWLSVLVAGRMLGYL
ncbi:hypothetical protein [Amaricoccus sp.]|uniref:hypothetical protein n=1 Tax=Amaricoccus sp. TaxID=1872485 RepID=UPI002606D4A0|nr:hypothetical protein [Amaricoccus sp.]HRO11673.1 hypothetical protein [Amaricoccus sp.]